MSYNAELIAASNKGYRNPINGHMVYLMEEVSPAHVLFDANTGKMISTGATREDMAKLAKYKGDANA